MPSLDIWQVVFKVYLDSKKKEQNNVINKVGSGYPSKDFVMKRTAM